MTERAQGRTVSILGATGSVGGCALDLISHARGAFRVEAVTAHRKVGELAALARRTGARLAVIGVPERYRELREALSGTGIEAAAGPQGLVEAAQRPVDRLVAAIVGAAGLAPLLAAVRRGTTVALANKEALVCAGDLLMDEARRSGSVLLPVDSEHNAIHQVFDWDRPDTVEKLILTASGGPFRTAGLSAMAAATPEQAVAHPNWSMGAKISVDSATLMNKGLELIEACRLFPVPEERIEIVLHPESIVHSLVAYRDGSVLAQLGMPDMRIPVAYALAWPGRMANAAPRLDLVRAGSLSFEKPDPARFPSLNLARAALRAGGQAPTVLNAANEVAVDAFLKRHIGFLDIVDVVRTTLDAMGAGTVASLDDVAEADTEARQRASAVILDITA